MGIKFVPDGAGRRVIMTGVFDPDEARAAIKSAPQPDSDSAYSIIDLSGVTAIDFDVEKIHSFLVVLRSAYPRPPEYRYGVVAPPGGAVRDLAELISVRDLLLGREPSQMPTIEIFATLAEARQWASKETTPAS